MNRIKLLFFASIRDRVGVKSAEMDVPADMTISQLKERLVSEYPGLKEALHAVLMTVNREYAFDEAVIPPNAEIALFPPVSGG